MPGKCDEPYSCAFNSGRAGFIGFMWIIVVLAKMAEEYVRQSRMHEIPDSVSAFLI